MYIGEAGVRGHGLSRPKCNQPVWSEKREGGGGETWLAARRRPGEALVGRGEGGGRAGGLPAVLPPPHPVNCLCPAAVLIN